MNTVAARLEYADREGTPALAEVIRYDPAQRMARAVKGGLGCWGAAVVAVFIPLAHFILVPSLLVAGPVVFVLRLYEPATFHGASGACPACGTAQRFTERGRLRPVLPVRCSACGRQLELRVPEPDPAS